MASSEVGPNTVEHGSCSCATKARQCHNVRKPYVKRCKLAEERVDALCRDLYQQRPELE